MTTANPSEPERSALITGAGGALGRAIALRLSSDGFAVGLVGRNRTTLEETHSLVEAAGGRSLVVAADVSDPDAVDAAVAQVERELGPLYAVINNAAIYPPTPFLEIPFEEFEDVVRVNQTAYFKVAQSAARLMVPRGAGAVVNIGSITLSGGWSNLASYVTTKGAVVGLTRALARELGPEGIRVNAVAPGAFPTKAEEIHDNPEEYSQHVINQQSIKRRGTNEELAAVVAFLVGKDSTFVTGQNIHVNGGWVME